VRPAGLNNLPAMRKARSIVPRAACTSGRR